MTRYITVTTLDEALRVLREHDDARPSHGGTDLVVQARTGKRALPPVICGIDRIDELGTIQVDSNEVRIGAGVTHAELLRSDVVLRQFTALSDAAALIGSPATRHLGTIGGNVANASPAADTVGPLIVLGAEAVLANCDTRRRVAVGRVAVAPGVSQIAHDELLVEIVLPFAPSRSGSAYLRLGYRASMEIAVVGAAASVAMADDGTIAGARLALTAVAPTVFEFDVAGIVEGRRFDDDVREHVAHAAQNACEPIDDVRAPADFRKRVVGVYAVRALAAAIARAEGSAPR